MVDCAIELLHHSLNFISFSPSEQNAQLLEAADATGEDPIDLQLQRSRPLQLQHPMRGFPILAKFPSVPAHVWWGNRNRRPKTQEHCGRNRIARLLRNCESIHRPSLNLDCQAAGRWRKEGQAQTIRIVYLSHLLNSEREPQLAVGTRRRWPVGFHSAARNYLFETGHREPATTFGVRYLLQGAEVVPGGDREGLRQHAGALPEDGVVDHGGQCSGNRQLYRFLLPAL